MRKTLQFLGLLTDNDIDWLLSAGEVETLRRDASLISAGETIDSVFILVEGRLALTEPGEESRAKYLGPGEVVGEISAKPAPSTAIAAVASRVLRVRRAALVDKCEADEEFAKRFENVIQSLVSQRMQQVLSAEEGDDTAAADANKDSVELDAEMLDQIALAAKKFDWIRASE